MTNPKIASMADRLVRARGAAPFQPEHGEPSPSTEHEAYQVQACVALRLGEAGGIGAWKTGRKSPADAPIMAPIFASAVRPSPAVFRRGELRLIGIELEVAFRVDKPLPPVDSMEFQSGAAECVSPLVAIEVVDSRIADYDAAGPLWKLADNQINGGLVVGEPKARRSGFNISSFEARLAFDGNPRFSGRADAPGGPPFETFCAFARGLGAHCGGLQVGQFVTTGSLTGLLFVEPGTRVTGEIAGLGEVDVRFER